MNALQVTPDTTLTFNLIRNDDKSTDGTAKCSMKLTHPQQETEESSQKNTPTTYLAFKVKTTQPRRYLVRPNQGIVAPGSSEKISIMLVEKDKQILLQSFDRLGQSALDYSKDKFLVQTCIVDTTFATDYFAKKQKLLEESSTGTGGGGGGGKTTSSSSLSMEGNKMSKEIAESLTKMWNAVSSQDEVEIHNKKLQVRHVVGSSSSTGAVSSSTSSSPHKGSRGSSSSSMMMSSSKGVSNPKTKLEDMTPEQMLVEITTIRRKYDELVTFSVNLTAERDILNNTLEQTKRDLNREIAYKKASGKNGGGEGRVTTESKSNMSGGGVNIFLFLFFVVSFFLLGIKLSHANKIEFLLDTPIVGDLIRMEL